MILRLDNVDFSFLVPKRGYKVTYKKVLGRNSCYTLDGTYHEDVLAYKTVVKVELKPMKADKLAILEAAIENCKEATYFDTKQNANVTKKVIVSLSPASLVMNAPSKEYWSDSLNTGMVLTIEER